jgi:hypothetical protein
VIFPACASQRRDAGRWCATPAVLRTSRAAIGQDAEVILESFLKSPAVSAAVPHCLVGLAAYRTRQREIKAGSIANTKATRTHHGLPQRFLVLDDHHDGGVILIDTIPDPTTGDNRIYDAGWESVPDQLSQEIIYSSYLKYVQKVLSVQSDFIHEENIDYDPALYRTP